MINKFHILLLAVCVLGSGLGIGLAAHAEEPATDGDISAEDWSRMAAGRTLTYMIGDAFFALEHYHLTGPGVTIQLADGRCMAGTWQHRDRQYCYVWEGNAPVCFRHIRSGGEILILQLENGVETGDIQVMTGVSDAPLICDGLVS